MAEQGTAEREAVRIEGASSATWSPARRASGTARILRALSIGALLLVLSGAGATAAQATTQPDPNPSTESPTAPDIDDPEITSPIGGSVVTSTSTIVTGTKSAGSGVQIQNGAGDVFCVIDPSTSTSFSCRVVLGAGASITIRAIATDAEGADAGGRDTVTVTSVPPPVITSRGSTPGNGLVRGTGIAGATVTVAASSGDSCASIADSSGAWACLLGGRAPDGEYTTTATQVAGFAPGSPSDASAPSRLVLDRTVPSPPVVTSPVGGSSLPETDVRFAGTGEDGATVTVFAGSASVCQAIVADGAWSCVAARLASGDVRVVAIQRDTADNTSAGSAAIALVIEGATATPTPTPTAPTPSDDPSATPSPVETEETPAPATPSPESSPEPSTPSPESNPLDGDTWDAATPFTTPRAPLFSSGSAIEWARTIALAALGVLGIALATQVAAGRSATSPSGAAAAPGRPAPTSRLGLTGRNRRDVVTAPRVVPAPSSAATVVSALVAVAALLILSKPVDGTPAYARLLFASVTATFVVALVSVAVPAVAARLLGAGRVHVTVDPRGFLVIAATAAVSRLIGLEPPLLFALVLTASTALAVRRVTEGRVAAVRILALAALGGLSWAVGSAIPSVGSVGFASSLVTETLNLLTAASLGSAALMLIPVGASAGRSLWAASRSAWIAVGLVVVTVELVLLGSRTPEMTAAVTGAGAVLAVACIALSASVWIWRRHVAPILAEEDAGRDVG